MRILPLALSALALLPLGADTQKAKPAPAKAGAPEARRKETLHLLGLLGLPKLNSDEARTRLEDASKDPKLNGYPAAYWKDYAEAASPEAFAGIMAPLAEKLYTPGEVRAIIKLLESREFKTLTQKYPQELAIFLDKNPALFRAKSYEAFSAYMTEVGKKLQAKHGIKAPAQK